MERLRWLRPCVRSVGCLAMIIGCQAAFGTCPQAPTNYGVDPAFIQADRRNPDALSVVRAAKSHGAVVVEGEGVIGWVEPEARAVAPNQLIPSVGAK